MVTLCEQQGFTLFSAIFLHLTQLSRPPTTSFFELCSTQPPPDFVSSRGSKRPADASGDNGAVEDKRARGGGGGGGGGASASSGDAAAAGGGVGGHGAGGSGGSGATHGLKSNTAAVTAALTANDGPRAIALLREMRALRQVPKLGAVQRWVRACDAAVHDPAALQVLDAVLRTCDPELVSVWLALVVMHHLHRGSRCTHSLLPHPHFFQWVVSASIARRVISRIDHA